MKLDWNLILKKENLKDWKVVETISGGLCMHSQKTLLVLPKDDALFLHELAHALTPKETKIDKTGHTAIWGDLFTHLIRKYLIEN